LFLFKLRAQVESKERKKLWPIPRDVSPLSSRALWCSASSRYVALAKDGTLLLFWTSGSPPDPSSIVKTVTATRMKQVELTPPAWGLVQCREKTCTDDVWLVMKVGVGWTVFVVFPLFFFSFCR
jgi:hypothetical protein